MNDPFSLRQGLDKRRVPNVPSPGLDSFGHQGLCRLRRTRQSDDPMAVAPQPRSRRLAQIPAPSNQNGHPSPVRDLTPPRNAQPLISNQ
jgi:hypothetical protein